MAKEEIPRGQLSLIILSTLFDNDKYGYEIIELIKEKTNGKLNIKQPSLYSSLRRMQEQGLISSYWRDSDIGGRRHYYSITDYGKKYSEKWQADWDSNFDSQDQTPETVHNQVEDANEEQKPTILQQGSLFADLDFIPKQSDDNAEQSNLQTNEDSLQYDLFSMQNQSVQQSTDNSNILSQLRQEADDESKNDSSNELITNLRNLGQAEKINANKEESEPVDIHKTYFELKRKQKSFTESIVDQNEDFSFSPISPVQKDKDVQEEKIENSFDFVTNSESVEEDIKDNIEESVSLEQEDLKEDNNEEDVAYTETYTETNNELETSTEFVDLNNINFNSFETKSEVKEEFDEFVQSEEQQDNALFDEEELKEEAQQSFVAEPVEPQPKQEEISHPPTHDDAIYITERLNYDTIPKVKRITSTRFENFATNNNSDFDKKLTSLYENKQSFEQYNAPQQEPVEEYNYSSQEEEIHEQQQAPLNSTNKNYAEFEDMKKNYNNLGDLKRYYANQKVKFGIHQKVDRTLDSFKYTKINKLNLISFAFITALCILESLILFLCLKGFQPVWNWLYLVVPMAFLGVECYYLVQYLNNKNKTILKSNVFNNNWIYNIIFFVVFSLIVFSINLLCGMSFDNISCFVTTLIYLIVVATNYPLFALSRYLVNKFNLIK